MLLIAVTACGGGTPHKNLPVSPPQNVVGGIPGQPNTARGDVINVGDKLSVSVIEDESLTGEYLINDSGNIALPLIGEVRAAGLTQNEFQMYLTQRLSQGFFVNPHVSVKMLSLRPFYILGEVNSPGVYDYTPSLNAFKAIAMAGGFTPRAYKNEYVIIRNVGGANKEFRANDLTPILPGDAIRVEERFF